MKKSIKTTDAIFPMPVLLVATYNDDGTVNVMNDAWGTMLDREHIALKLLEERQTVQNIKKRKAFTISIADVAHVAEADYFGMESGKTVPDKLGKANMTAVKSDNVDAPIINEFPISLECEFIEYQGGPYGIGVIGKVVNVSVEERIMIDGKVDIDLLEAIAYDPYTHGYYKVGGRVGNAFSEGLKLK